MPTCRSALLTFLLMLTEAHVSGGEYIANVKATASSEQVKGLMSAENVVNDRGLKEIAPGKFALTNNGYADRGCMWQSGYLPTGAQENPLIQFDFGKEVTVVRFHVWNHNGSPNRGFRDVTVYASDDGKSWRTVNQRFRFARASGKPEYVGEEYSFKNPVSARFLRFWAESSHRQGGQPDIAGLGKVRFVSGDKVVAVGDKPIGPFPADSGAVSVKDAPYSAVGDGKTDDTQALQKAIDDTQGTSRFLYFPAGTYLISKSLEYKTAYRFGYSNLRGEARDKTILRLKDGTCTNPNKPQAVLFNGYNGKKGGTVSADWFHNHFSDFTIDTGRGNSGAVGLQFYSNNLGLLKNVTIRSGDRSGVIGLDLGHADQNGPHLIKNVTVSGFDIGVRAGATVNSQTIESLELNQQNKVGLLNGGQCLSIRDFTFKGRVPAFQSTFGVVALVDAKLTGSEETKDVAAVTSGEVLFARNVKASNYKRAIHHSGKGGTPSPEGLHVGEYVSSKVLTLHDAPQQSLNLAVKDSPEVLASNPVKWANVRHFRAIEDPDDTASMQRAIDSGAEVVYFPSGSSYAITGVVEIRGKVRILTGMFSWLRATTLKEKPTPVLRVGKGEGALLVENLRSGLALECAGDRTVVVRNCEISGIGSGSAGELYLENVVGDWTTGKKQKVWARQLNTEREGTHLINEGGQLWILGLKTERGGTLIDTQASGKTEVIGGLCYTTTKGKLGPMFRTKDSQMSITIGEVCYTGDPYAVLAESRCGDEVKVFKRGTVPLRPAFLQGSVLPLLRAGK